MKSTGKIISILCVLVAAGLAIGVALERQAQSRLEQANRALRQQLSQRDALTAENQRLSNLLAQPKSSTNRTSERPEAEADERAKELVRLRGEVEALRQQSKEIETLRADARQARAARQGGPKPLNAGQSANSGAGGSGAQLEILRADYGTANTNLDVAAELQDRVRGDSLKAIASNSLKGDPEFGQTKRLTIVYRIGGVTMTNEFREGDFVVLPKE
jgi:phage shock protein A